MSAGKWETKPYRSFFLTRLCSNSFNKQKPPGRTAAFVLQVHSTSRCFLVFLCPAVFAGERERACVGLGLNDPFHPAARLWMSLRAFLCVFAHALPHMLCLILICPETVVWGVSFCVEPSFRGGFGHSLGSHWAFLPNQRQSAGAAFAVRKTRGLCREM